MCNQCFRSADLSDPVFRRVCRVLERNAEEANFGWNNVLSSVTGGVETGAVRSRRTHFPLHQARVCGARWQRRSQTHNLINSSRTRSPLPSLQLVFDKQDLVMLGNRNTPENKMFMFTGLELQLNFTAHEVYPQPPHLRTPLSLGALAHITSG